MILKADAMGVSPLYERNVRPSPMSSRVAGSRGCPLPGWRNCLKTSNHDRVSGRWRIRDGMSEMRPRVL